MTTCRSSRTCRAGSPSGAPPVCDPPSGRRNGRAPPRRSRCPASFNSSGDAAKSWGYLRGGMATSVRGLRDSVARRGDSDRCRRCSRHRPSRVSGCSGIENARLGCVRPQPGPVATRSSGAGVRGVPASVGLGRLHPRPAGGQSSTGGGEPRDVLAVALDQGLRQVLGVNAAGTTRRRSNASARRSSPRTAPRRGTPRT